VLGGELAHDAAADFARAAEDEDGVRGHGGVGGSEEGVVVWWFEDGMGC
jgi:hypothetical protein